MEIAFTKHVADKFRTKEAKKFKITKTRIMRVLGKSKLQTQLPEGIMRAVGKLDKSHSLCVVYKLEGDIIKVITFFPAEKGRYED